MKRLMMVVMSLVASLAVASAAAAPAPKATGGVVGTSGGTVVHLSFTAQPTTDGAKGQAQYSASNGNSFHGTVTCYHQDGNTATFAGEITKGTEDTSTGYFLINVTDNGEGNTENTPDQFRVRVASSSYNCEESSGSGIVPADDGNIQVHQE